MKTPLEIQSRLEENLIAAFSCSGRPEDRAILYLGASMAILLAMEELRLSTIPEEHQKPLREQLSRIGNIACDGSTKAVNDFIALPWWRKIVRFA